MENPDRKRISRQTKSDIAHISKGTFNTPLQSRETPNTSHNINSPSADFCSQNPQIKYHNNTEKSAESVRIHRKAKVSILKDKNDKSESQGTISSNGNKSLSLEESSANDNRPNAVIVSKQKPKIRKQQRRIHKAENELDSSLNAGKTIRETAVNKAANAAKEIAVAPIKAHKIAAEKTLEQGKQSTGFSDGSNQSENSHAAEMVAAGFKKISDPENMISAARHIRKAPKQIKQNLTGIRKSTRGTKQAAQSIGKSAEGIAAAIKNYKHAQYINSIVSQSKGKAALNTAKNISDLAVSVVKNLASMIANAIRSVFDGSAVLWFIASIIILIIVIVLAIGSIIFSGYGIFFTDEADNPLKIEEIVRNVNNDYQSKIKQITEAYDNISVSLIRYEGNKMQWKYILALYAVKYSSEGENILTVDKQTEKRIKEIFYKVHSISAEYITEENPHAKQANAPPDVNPYWTVLVVTTKSKPLSDVMNEMKFTSDQREQVMSIVDSDTDELWNEILYGHNGNGGPLLAKIAAQQLGQTPQAYTSFTGVPNGRNVEWSGSFVCWCANEAGYVTQGLYPQTNDKYALIDWFKNRGLWENADKQPNIGDTIFISYKGNEDCDLCGIICKIEDKKVYYISNEDDIVGTQSRSLINQNNTIMGYGILPPMSGLRGDTVEEQVFNYLRKEGYSAVSACAVLANIQGDCGCDPEQFSKDHDYYTGILKWNGTEMTEFKKWCSSNAYDWRNLESQLIYYEYWVGELDSKGYWSSNSARFHPNIDSITSTNAFKSISANDYNGDTAKALYAATVIFTDDIARSNYLSADESARYSYAVEFYNYLVSDSVDGSSVSAWNPDYASEIGIFHLY